MTTQAKRQIARKRQEGSCGFCCLRRNRMVAGERQKGGISSITVKCKISESVGREVTGWGPAIKRSMTGEWSVLSTTVKH